MEYKEQNSDDTWPTDWTDLYHNSTATKATIENLTNGTSYRVQVRATNSVDDGLWAAYVTGSPAQPPDAPDEVTIESGDRSLKVSWSTPTNLYGATITGYKVRYCDYTSSTTDYCSDESNDWTTKTLTSTATTTTIGSANNWLTNGNQYYIEVRATSNQGESDWSTQAQATPGAPAAPEAPSVTAGTDSGTLDVSWLAPADRGETITSYKVAYCNNTDGDCAAGQWSSDDHYDVDNRSTTIYVTSGKTYKVRVRAENARGWGLWSATSSATPT